MRRKPPRKRVFGSARHQHNELFAVAVLFQDRAPDIAGRTEKSIATAHGGATVEVLHVMDVEVVEVFHLQNFALLDEGVICVDTVSAGFVAWSVWRLTVHIHCISYPQYFFLPSMLSLSSHSNLIGYFSMRAKSFCKKSKFRAFSPPKLLNLAVSGMSLMRAAIFG